MAFLLPPGNNRLRLKLHGGLSNVEVAEWNTSLVYVIYNGAKIRVSHKTMSIKLCLLYTSVLDEQPPFITALVTFSI